MRAPPPPSLSSPSTTSYGMDQLLRPEIAVPAIKMNQSQGHALCVKRQAMAASVGERQPLQRKVIWRPLSTKVRPNNAVSLGLSYQRLQTSSIHGGALSPIFTQPSAQAGKTRSM